MGMPMLVGAGVGALGGAITGRNPFQTALLGASLGSGYGALTAPSAAAGAAGAGAGAIDLGANSALGLTSAGGSIGGTGALTATDIGAGFGYANGLGTAANYVPASQAAGYAAYVPEATMSSTAIPSSLIDQGVIKDTNFLATKNIGASALENPYYAGNELIAQAIEKDPTLLDKLKPYANIQNLQGASMIANQFQPRQPSFAPQGHVSQGQAPQGGLGQGGIEGLLSELQKRQKQQYQPISLL